MLGHPCARRTTHDDCGRDREKGCRGAHYGELSSAPVSALSARDSIDNRKPFGVILEELKKFGVSNASPAPITHPD
jgi:hypothetical protein